MVPGLRRVAVPAVILVCAALAPSGVVGQHRRQDGGVAGNFSADGSFTGSSLTGWRPIGGATWRAEQGEIVATAGTGAGCSRTSPTRTSP